MKMTTSSILQITDRNGRVLASDDGAGVARGLQLGSCLPGDSERKRIIRVRYRAAVETVETVENGERTRTVFQQNEGIDAFGELRSQFPMALLRQLLLAEDDDLGDSGVRSSSRSRGCTSGRMACSRLRSRESGSRNPAGRQSTLRQRIAIAFHLADKIEFPVITLLPDEGSEGRVEGVLQVGLGPQDDAGPAVADEPVRASRLMGLAERAVRVPARAP